ncbi:PAS domain-containing methyl-accepting chemotaxis protein [Aquisalimonas sp.]|uniref:methyl-accepting chemotaxis protein n=1 Tax=unclassified Aquisalimonas TaxID=2644645 RepID=UPI0025C4750D|nr:PAS domain-containing methyl-accepting chemotaxis protein [Aquisalimonas sp.]
MRNNEPVTQERVDVERDANILSTTDSNGRITHVNDEFVKISGFEREELIGQPHNIIRHPDMPRQAFLELWMTLQKGQSWMGIVKNRCKSGDHYWVHAYVTPIFDADGNLQECQSIRQKPDEEDVERAAALYEKLKRAEPESGRVSNVTRRARCPGVMGRVAATCLAGCAPMVTLAAYSQPAGSVVFVAAASTTIFLAGLWWAFNPLRNLERAARQVVDDPLAEAVYCGRHDENARVHVALTRRRTEVQAITKRILDTTLKVQSTAASALRAIDEGSQKAEYQTSETQQVAGAMEEMAQSVHEVACGSSQGLGTVGDARDAASQGREAMDNTKESLHELKLHIEASSSVVSRLASETERISGALALIQQITEKTNLLALNAAIEAARAGDAGRGFAVVADEVRDLANSTAASTKEVQGIIESLQQAAGEAVESMQHSTERAQQTEYDAERAHDVLGSIDAKVAMLQDATKQIKTATEEQSSTAEEVNRNMSNIDVLAGELCESCTAARESMDRLAAEIRDASGLVRRFSSWS